MNEQPTQLNHGTLFAVLLTVLFIGLKLTGHIDWHWIWVLAPMWISVAIAIFFVLLALLILLIMKIFDL